MIAALKMAAASLSPFLASLRHHVVAYASFAALVGSDASLQVFALLQEHRAVVLLLKLVRPRLVRQLPPARLRKLFTQNVSGLDSRRSWDNIGSAERTPEDGLILLTDSQDVVFALSISPESGAATSGGLPDTCPPEKEFIDNSSSDYTTH